MNTSLQDPFAASSECDLSDLRRREIQVRGQIEAAQNKYLLCKEQEEADQ